MKNNIYIVLPAYNEEESIGKLLGRIKYNMEDSGFANYKVIVVNDGSKDNTVSVVEEYQKNMPIEILNHPVNLGLGATIRDGLYHAAKIADDEDIIISMDADDTHTPGLILRMARMVREGFDVVIASRYQKNSRIFGLSRFRKLVSYLASIIFRTLLPIRGVKDFTCGFRAYRANILKEALSKYGEKFIDQDGFQSMVDILLKLRKMDGVIFGEVPFILRYDLKEGESKMDVKSTTIKTLKLIVKRKFERNG
jgi:dolichol-phosphate mannosyltransferase